MPRPVEVLSGETNKPIVWRDPMVTMRSAPATRVRVQ
jgi:hypothetical protein